MGIDTVSYLTSQSSCVAYSDPRGEYTDPASSWKEGKDLVSVFTVLPVVSNSKELPRGIEEAGVWPK